MVKKKALSLDFKDLKEVRSSMASEQTIFKKPTQEDWFLDCISSTSRNQQKDLDFRRSGFLHQGLFEKKNIEISNHPFCGGGSPSRIPSHEVPQMFPPQLVPTFAGGLSWGDSLTLEHWGRGGTLRVWSVLFLVKSAISVTFHLDMLEWW